MPDIFGKTQSDYKHLTKIGKAGMLDSHNAQLKQRGRVHNFDALPSMHRPVAVPLNDTEASAAAVGFATNNYQAMQAQVEEILYDTFRADAFYPIITNIPEGARSYSYRVVNRYGLGKFIDNAGKTANPATVSMQNVPYALEYGGIIPSWTLEDLRNAAFGGISLDTETIRAGTEGCMDHIEQVGISGDSAYGYTGLINNPDVTITAAGGKISTLSAAEMITFIQTRVTAIITATQEIMGRVLKEGMTIYLPVAQADLILHTVMSTDASKSVWEYVKVNNMWTKYTGQELQMQIIFELAGGAANGTDDRAIFGLNNERIMEFAMPIQPRITQTLPVAYGVEAPMEYKISGLNVKRPDGLHYYDTI